MLSALRVYNGEFDPGSGRTLEVCLIHASRTGFIGACFDELSGARVSNAWVTCLLVWDNSGKPGLIPDDHIDRMFDV